MNLASTTQSLELLLGEAHTTSPCDIVASWADVAPGFFTLGEHDLVSNGTTAVVVAPAPPTGYQRQVKEVRVYNADTVSHTVTLRLTNGSAHRIIQKGTIAAGASFVYTPEAGGGAAPVDLSGYAPLASPTFSGDPKAPTAAVNDSDTSIATTAYVTGQASATAPLPNNVAAIGSSLRYAREDHVHAAAPNIGRNLLHNSLFNIQQRGAGPFTTSVYTLDRWVLQLNTDANSVTPATLADADRTAIGDEEATFALQDVFTGNAAAGAFSYIEQRIENVRRHAGKTLTVSFWAKAASGTPKIGINSLQNFGTGGSPSTAVNALATGNAVTLSTSWARYQSTLALPSIVGKTLGSNGDSATNLRLFLSSGATNNALAGNIGVQSGTIQLWGVQFEVGIAATPLEKTGTQQDLANCQRFYQANIPGHAIAVASGAGIFNAGSVNLPVTMRATPTVAWQANIATPTNCANPTADMINASGFRALGSSSAAGLFAFDSTFTAAADL